jgi:hypothetical protein
MKELAQRDSVWIMTDSSIGTDYRRADGEAQSLLPGVRAE